MSDDDQRQVAQGKAAVFADAGVHDPVTRLGSIFRAAHAATAGGDVSGGAIVPRATGVPTGGAQRGGALPLCVRPRRGQPVLASAAVLFGQWPPNVHS